MKAEFNRQIELYKAHGGLIVTASFAYERYTVKDQNGAIIEDTEEWPEERKQKFMQALADIPLKHAVIADQPSSVTFVVDSERAKDLKQLFDGEAGLKVSAFYATKQSQDWVDRTVNAVLAPFSRQRRAVMETMKALKNG